MAIRKRIPLLSDNAPSLLLSVAVEAVALHIAHWASARVGMAIHAIMRNKAI